MSRPVSIYELIDPITNECRYVGKTVSPLSDRLKVHVRQSKIAKKPTHKEAWIKGLIKKGKRPIIRLIEVATLENWAEREVILIKEYREKGVQLTNISIGGDSGFSGGGHSEESKKRLADSMRGNKYSLGVKWTPEQREKMKNRIPWNKGKKTGKSHSEETKALMSLSRRGEKHHAAKLSKEDVLEIRRRAANGETGLGLAKEYGLSHSYACQIIRKKAWSWL